MSSKLTRTRKAALVAGMLRLAGGGAVPGHVVRGVAAQNDVSIRTVYRWLSDPALRSGDVSDSTPRSDRFDIDTFHLTVLAQEQDIRSAHAALVRAGEFKGSYETFARALRRVAPDRVAGALHGFKGVINNRMYLTQHAPHKNHTWHVDHTKADLWVVADHRSNTPIRPFLTTVTDASTGLIHAFLWKQPINSEAVSAALAETAAEHDYFGVAVSGVPEQVVSDNAAEHFTGAITKGATSLGFIINPTTPYSSWQNGKAERTIDLVNRRLSSRAPGALHAGTTREGRSRHMPRVPSKMDPAAALSWNALLVLLDEVLTELNTDVRVERLGKRTRLEAYADDPTESRLFSDAELRYAMLSTAKESYRATKNGIHFEKGQYVAANLHVGTNYKIRHLARGRDFIEVFTVDGDYVTRAWRHDVIPKHARLALLAERARHEREYQAIEAGVKEHRRKIAAALRAAIPDDPDESVPAPTDTKTVLVTPKSAQPEPPPVKDLSRLTQLFGGSLPGHGKDAE
ncbi:MAG: hypothetical protein ACOX61_01200 [Brooklawnia sp.]|jgi:transposase InsO family protein